MNWGWSWPCFDWHLPVNDAVHMIISRNLHKKSHEVSIKTRSTSASLSFKGQETKQFVNRLLIGLFIGNARIKLLSKLNVQTFNSASFIFISFLLSIKELVILPCWRVFHFVRNGWTHWSEDKIWNMSVLLKWEMFCGKLTVLWKPKKHSP